MMSLATLYDKHYSGGYRKGISGFEVARCKALGHFLTRVLKLGSAGKVLDYGAGNGLHVGLWEEAFSHAELRFCDISSVAMEHFAARHPRYADRYALIRENVAPYDEGTFDVVVSVEVMEHVEDLSAYVSDIARILVPGGHFVWTTPCANPLSVEHAFSALTGRIEQTDEGYRKWTWEDPTHLRRMLSREMQVVLEQKGFSDVCFRFRSHLFSFLCTYLPTRRGERLRNWLMTLDYSLFRRLPNGASVVAGAKKAAP